MNFNVKRPNQRFGTRAALPYVPENFDLASARSALVEANVVESLDRSNIPISQGTQEVENRAMFEVLARRDDVPGALKVLELKFLITGVDGDEPELYFLNTKNVKYHFHFASQALKLPLSNLQFNQQTYFLDDRKFLAGTIIAHDNYTDEHGEKGVYALEFWPSDPVKVNLIDIAYQAIKIAMPFAAGKLAYHPAGETHQDLFKVEQSKFEERGIRHISTDELFGNISFSPLNLGEGFGRLRLIDGTNNKPPSISDVVIFKHIPNDLSHVAGVMTEDPQTPLSHINLRAKQNDTPNAYLKAASEDPRVKPLIGKLVRFEAASDDINIREATVHEVNEHLETIRPSKPQIPVRDLDRTNIASLDDLGNADLSAYGAKAANVAELGKILITPGMVPKGFAVPFVFYHRFMTENGLYFEVETMIDDEAFQLDPEVREAKLAKFRKRIKKANMAQDMLDDLAVMHATFPVDQPLRCRSSTNNEDLEGFNGAGLYDSCTHREDEGHIQKSIKQVWASLWNYRAYEERDFYRIDHFQTAMAVLVHSNFDDELANGVAVTKNIYDPEWPGYFVNVQVGEALVTNPVPGQVPDELAIVTTVVSENPRTLGNEVIYIRRSSLVEPPNHVLTKGQLDLLLEQMEKIQAHFKVVYKQQGNRKFAMDLEFKIDKNEQLVIKQARPWID